MEELFTIVNKKVMKKRIINLFLSFALIVSSLFSISFPVVAEESKIIDDFDAAWQYSAGDAEHGGWNYTRNYTPDMDPSTSEHYSNTVGATATLTFSGTKLEIYGKRAPEHTMFTIKIDDQEPVEIDEYASAKATNQLLFTSAELQPGNHTALITVIDKKNPDWTPASNGKQYGVQLEYAKVYGFEKTDEDNFTIIEDSYVSSTNEPFKFKYSGNWHAETGYDIFSNGDDHYSDKTDLNAYFEVTFYGNKIELYGSKRNTHGDYIVYLDGEEIGTASGYIDSENRQHQVKIFEKAGLSEGIHTLKVTLDPSTPAARACIQIDYAKAYHEDIPATGITLDKNELLLESGQSYSLNATLSPWYASGDILWSSSDENALSVNEYGVITALGNEKKDVIVTAEVNKTDIKAEAIVHVVPKIDTIHAYIGDVNRLEIQEDYQELLYGYDSDFVGTAWRGDFLSSKIVVTTRDKNVTGVEIKASDFINENGDVLNSSNIEINWLKEVKANIGKFSPNAPVKDFPDVIHEGGPTDIEKQSVKFAWITLNVPEDTQPGIYEGTLTVSADGLEIPYELNYQIEVLDLLQPSVEDVGTTVQIWQHPFSVAEYYGVKEEDYFTEEHFKYMRASMKEYYELGGRDVAANIVEEPWNHQSYYGDPSMVKWTKKADGSWEFDYTWYDAWINFQIECGIINPEKSLGQIKCFSIVPWNNQVTYFDESQNTTVKVSLTPGSDEWKEIWTEFLNDFMNHSMEKGWFDITYIAMDERPIDMLIPTVELIESIKNENGDSFKIASAFNFENTAHTDLTDNIDDISISINHFSHEDNEMREFAERRNKLGLRTTIYTCQARFPSSFTISDPANNYWVMWDSLSQKTNGFMRWAWDNWTNDPLTDATFNKWESGDMWFLYPSEKDNEENTDYFYSTPRYEMMKKGIYDINKAKYIMSYSEELSKKINELAQSMTMPNYKQEYGATVPASEQDRELLFSDVNRLYENLMLYSKQLLTVQADYTALNSAILKATNLDKNLYKDFSAVEKALDAVIPDLDITHQEEVDTMAKAIEDAISALEYKDADYSKVNDAVTKANGLNKDLYKDFSGVEKALEAVNPDLDITHQEEVDAMAKAIEDAISALEYKDADYSAVEKAKEKVPTDLSIYTEESVKALNDALAGVVEGKNITEQEEVDAMAKAIENAINGLVKKDTGNSDKPTEPTTPTDPDSDKPETPSTSDNYHVAVFAELMILSAGVLAFVLLRRKREAD